MSSTIDAEAGRDDLHVPGEVGRAVEGRADARDRCRSARRPTRYSQRIIAFQPAPQAVTQPVTRLGRIAGTKTRRR